jgi:cell wall assembly regulator SMI1
MASRNPQSLARRTWQVIVERLNRKDLALLRFVAPPASKASIVKTERIFGFRLPALLRELYLIHDGFLVDEFATGSYFLSIGASRDAWSVMNRVADAGHFRDSKVTRVKGPVRRDWWNRRWIPIATDGADNFRCVDLSPAPGGTFAQVIEFWHDSPERVVAADDVASFLLEHVDEDEWAAANRDRPVGRLTRR